MCHVVCFHGIVCICAGLLDAMLGKSLILRDAEFSVAVQHRVGAERTVTNCPTEKNECQ